MNLKYWEVDQIWFNGGTQPWEMETWCRLIRHLSSQHHTYNNNNNNTFQCNILNWNDLKTTKEDPNADCQNMKSSVAVQWPSFTRDKNICSDVERCYVGITADDDESDPELTSLFILLLWFKCDRAGPPLDIFISNKGLSRTHLQLLFSSDQILSQY